MLSRAGLGEVASVIDGFDLCVIGAGALGIYLASRHTENGRRVVLLEAGSDTADSKEHAIEDPIVEGGPYHAATDGRRFVLGGTTTAWGGVLAEHSPSDVLSPTERLSGWPTIVAAQKNFGPAVLRKLSLDSDLVPNAFSPDRRWGNLEPFSANGFRPASALYLPARRKNFSQSVLSRAVRGSGTLALVTSARLVGFERLSPDGEQTRLTAAVVSGPDGARHRIRAKEFVLAAGALESTRMLLSMADDGGPDLSGTDLGIGLADHLSLEVGEFDRVIAPAVASLLGPTFVGGFMRSLRLVSPASRGAGEASFAHLAFHFDDPGVMYLRDFLRAVQERALPRAPSREQLASFGTMLRLGFGRLARHRLALPASTRVVLQLDLAQGYTESNKLLLDESRDSMGLRRLRIRWSVTDREAAIAEASCRDVARRWNAAMPSFPVQHRNELTIGTRKLHDAYHPVGTCRMGTDRRSVVDGNLRVNGLHNLFVVSTAVLPTAGSANPTYSTICLAERMVQRGMNSSAFRDGAASRPGDEPRSSRR